MESTISERVWYKGHPPHIGWWNASSLKLKWLWSWWDGEQWSHCVMDNMDETWAATQASIPNDNSETVVWCDYYPEDARVPRVKFDAITE